MKKLFSHRGDFTFASIALVLFALLVGYAIFMISSLAMNLNEAIRPNDGGNQLIENFDFDKLNQLLGD